MENTYQNIPLPVHLIRTEPQQQESEPSQIPRQISWMTWRVGQLFNLFEHSYNDENFKIQCLKQLKGLYAIGKTLSLHFPNNVENLLNLDFFMYIHQCVLYDFIYDEMANSTKAETPEHYKMKAKKRLTKKNLKDILSLALSEAGLVDDQIEKNIYINLYLNNPSWSSSKFQDEDDIYLKTKSHCNYIFTPTTYYS